MKTYIRIAGCVIASLPAVLLGSTQTDRQIEDAANNSYNYKVVLDGHVNVASSDGVVTLTGTVPDKSDKDLAAETVENLPGVVRVDNEIGVNAAYPEYSDSWIALKIHSMLLIRANVSAANTRVAVQDGVVTLTGTAQSDAQRDLTEAYVKDIEHVKAVRNELVVKVAPQSEESTGNVIDDASITGEVKYELLTDPNTSAAHTKVVTDNGVVIITGTASTDAERDIVTRLAQSVGGVKHVENMMTVQSGK